MAAQKFNWLGKLGMRRGSAVTLVPQTPHRDLPLPRSPEPMPDSALIFAQGATRPPLRLVEKADQDVAPFPVPSIANGADLRAMLERFEQSHRRRQALSQAADARARIVEQLGAGKAATPSLRLVDPEDGLSRARLAAEDERRIEMAMEEALASALGTLKRLSALSRD